MQVQRVLPLEVERFPRNLEKREARSVVHFEEAVQAAPRVDLERADEPQAEEVLVETARFLRVPAAVCVVMQTLDHWSLPSVHGLTSSSAIARAQVPPGAKVRASASVVFAKSVIKSKEGVSA